MSLRMSKCTPTSVGQSFWTSLKAHDVCVVDGDDHRRSICTLGTRCLTFTCAPVDHPPNRHIHCIGHR